MASDIGFEFPQDQSQQWDGFNDSGIEHFSGSPFEHLGREVTQNALDAFQTNPVRLKIKLLEIPTKTIPDLAGLKRAMRQCKAGAEEEGDKANRFFENALGLLDKPKVSVLQIADFNTKGVVGPCVNGQPFFAMMKASGQSKKASDTATGSYGIGKFAPFTVSGLRTIFLSTVWQDEKSSKWHHYVQGKSILMSHQDGKMTKRGTGFWGVKTNCSPVEKISSDLPEWLVRSEKKDELAENAGTTLSILGFEAKKEWQNILAANIAENFFGAIQRGALEIDIEGAHTITRDTLAGIFQNDAILKSLVDQRNEPEKFNNVSKYLKTLSDNTEVIVEHTQNLYLGDCELRILIGEGLPKKIAFLRNGMLITDELSGLIRFGDFKEFVAVFECQSTKGNALLREMEPPRHDDFEPDRIGDPKKKKQGKEALNQLAKWVREMLKRHAQDPVSEVTNIDELADLLGYEDEQEKGRSGDEENPAGNIIIRARQLPKRERPAAAEINEDENGELESIAPFNPSPDPSPPGPDPSPIMPIEPTPGTEEAGGKRKSSAAMELRNVRAVPLTPSKRRLAFTPAVSGAITIEIQDSGADQNYHLNAVSTNIGNIKEGKIEGINVTAGERCVVEVELDRPFGGTLRVAANAV